MKKKVSIYLTIVGIYLFIGTIHATNLKVCTWCQVSSNPAENDGFCRVSETGSGDVCYCEGEGPACSETGSKFCDE
jgi:hypothetical protein